MRKIIALVAIFIIASASGCVVTPKMGHRGEINENGERSAYEPIWACVTDVYLWPPEKYEGGTTLDENTTLAFHLFGPAPLALIIAPVNHIRLLFSGPVAPYQCRGCDKCRSLQAWRDQQLAKAGKAADQPPN